MRWDAEASSDQGGHIRSYDLYGVHIASAYDFANPVPRSEADPAAADLVFTCVRDAPTWVDWSAADVVDEQGRRADGTPDFVFARLPSCDAVRIPEALDFYLTGDHIVCHVVDERERYLVEIALLGMVLALWLERRGVLTLHASVAVFGDVAAGFLGSSGGGKTSTLVACLARGHALLADDLLALHRDDDVVWGQRGYPALRLLPEQADRFLGGHVHLPVLHPLFRKRRALVGPGGFGRFASGATELRRLYLPERQPGEQGPVTLERLPAADSVMALMRHSFLPREMERFGWQGRRFQPMVAVAARVPVVRLQYPSGFDRLPEVLARVEQDLREEGLSIS